MNIKYENITKDIIGSAFEVHNILGYGFLEKVYQKALQVELLRRGHIVELEHGISVKYKGILVGKYAADLFVDEKVIVELKVAAKYNPQDEAQLLNQLKATEQEVGLLINLAKRRSNSNVLFISNVLIRVPRWFKSITRNFRYWGIWFPGRCVARDSSYAKKTAHSE